MKKTMVQSCHEISPMEFTPLVAEGLNFVFDILAHSLTSAIGNPAEALHRLRLRAPGDADVHPSTYFDEEIHPATI